MTEPGTMIAGRYRVLRSLGAGAMGAVWLARDTALGRLVAVKSVRAPLVEEGDPHRSAGASGQQRAMREARLLARVNHPNAVAIYDVAMHEGRPCLVMEYVESQNLAEVISECGTMSAERAAEVGCQVASALAEVHEAGIVHRDVKPANVLLSADGAAKVTDFGIARGDGDVTLTATGTVWGTPAYVAPEVARGAVPTTKSDVYSLGASLYLAVEGAPPHGTDASPLVLLGRIANQPVPPPARGGELSAVLERLLDPDPESRSTMPEAVRLLSAVRRADSRRFDGGDVTEPRQSTAGDPVEPGSILGTVGADEPGGGREHNGATNPAGQGGRRRGRAGLIAVAIAAVVVLGALALVQLVDDDADMGRAVPPSSSPSVSTGPSSSTSSTRSPSRPQEAAPQPRAEQSASTSEQNDADASSATELFTPTRMVQAVARYYRLMPDDTRAGFGRLGPTLRSQGFASYDSFWDGIESVSVKDLRARPGDRTVTATVVFNTDDGRTSTELHRFELVPDDTGDGLLIDTDTIVD